MSGNSRKTSEELDKWCMMLYGIRECHVVVCCAISIYFSPVWCHLMKFLPKLSAAEGRRKVRRWVSQFVEGYEHMPWCQISRLTWDPRDCQWRTTSWSWFCRLPVRLSFCQGHRHKLQLAPLNHHLLQDFFHFLKTWRKIISGGTWSIPCIYAINLNLPINQYIFKSVWLSEVKNVIYMFDSGHILTCYLQWLGVNPPKGEGAGVRMVGQNSVDSQNSSHSLRKMYMSYLIKIFDTPLRGWSIFYISLCFPCSSHQNSVWGIGAGEVITPQSREAA